MEENIPQLVVLDQDIYYALVSGVVLYALTWVNTAVPSSTEIDNPFLKAALQVWEVFAANVFKSAPAPRKVEEE